MKKSYRILIINWQDIMNPLSGGAEVHLFEIFSRLSDRYEIHLLCDSFEGAEPEETIDGIHIHRRGLRNTFNFIVPSSFKELNRRYNFDLVIEDLNKIPFFGRFYIPTKRLGIVHHLFGRVIYQETDLLSGTYVYFTERLIPKFYRDIPMVCVSKSTAEELIGMGIPEKNIYVVYNGVDLEKYRPVKKSESPLIVSVGRIKKYKRLDVLIDAMRILKSKNTKVRLEIVGTGDALDQLKTLVSRYRIEDIVNFRGYVSETEKAELLARAWCSINTSPKEGWGLTSMESQASGTLSIVPDSPGLRETVIHGETGFIYPWGNSEKLAEYIEHVLKKPDTAKTMGRNARRWAERFTWDSSAHRMSEIIETLIG